MRKALLFGFGFLIGVLQVFASRSHAQTTGTMSWRTYTVMNDTIALGAMDTSKVVDLTNHRFVSARIQVFPAAGVAEPFSEIVVRVVGCITAQCDSFNAGIIQLQPVADRSYIGPSTGDSLAYGNWATLNKLQVGNGEIHYRWQRTHTVFAYPNANWIEVGNKGTLPHVRYLYFQVVHVAEGASGATSFCRVIITVQLSN